MSGIYEPNFRALKSRVFFTQKNRLLVFYKKYTKLTFGVSDVLMITVITPYRVKGVSLLFPRCGILRFGKDMIAPGTVLGHLSRFKQKPNFPKPE